jgi:hypothetical protein
MSKHAQNPMTRKAASRIISSETKKSGGEQPAGGHGARIDAGLQRKEAVPPPKAKP